MRTAPNVPCSLRQEKPTRSGCSGCRAPARHTAGCARCRGKRRGPDTRRHPVPRVAKTQTRTHIHTSRHVRVRTDGYTPPPSRAFRHTHIPVTAEMVGLRYAVGVANTGDACPSTSTCHSRPVPTPGAAKHDSVSTPGDTSAPRTQAGVYTVAPSTTGRCAYVTSSSAPGGPNDDPVTKTGVLPARGTGRDGEGEAR
jgi:hypothetical protein